jgi:peptidoglycan-N-acetylglucosamine deacetylase
VLRDDVSVGASSDSPVPPTIGVSEDDDELRGWTCWGRDWRAGATPSSIAADAAGDLRGGEVVLLHDADHYSAPGSWERTVAALPLIIERIHAAGLRCGPVTRAGSRRAGT